MKRDEFIRELLGAAQESGILEAEIYYSQRSAMRVEVRAGELENYTVSEAGGLSLRGLIDGKMGMAYTEALDKDAIVLLIRGVLESATLISEQNEQTLYVPSGEAYEPVDTRGNLQGAEARIALAMKLDQVARSIDPRVTELGWMQVRTVHEAVRLINTHGVDLTHEADLCVAYLSAIAREGERVTTGDAVAALPSLGDLDPEALAAEAVAEALSRLHAATMPSGETPVILRNTAMADLLEAFLGIFSADAAQKGMSLLKDREGQAIAAPCLTLLDDPLLAGGIASRSFDAEGVPTRRKAIIEGGTLKTLLHNLKTARKAGVVSTGNAARGGYAGPVGVAPTNVIVAPGDKPLETLEASMGSGLVITSVEGLHAGANAVSGDFSLLARGYRVTDGARGEAVEQITVAGNILSLLKEIVEIGSDTRSGGGQVRCPSVLVRALSIAGA